MKTSTRAMLALGLAIASFAALPAGASALPPANDALASAIPLTIGQAENGTTIDAVDEGEQISGLGWALPNNVWYTYTPSTSGLFSLDVCADFGVNVVVATGNASPFALASTVSGEYSYVQQYSTLSDCAGGAGTKYHATVGPFNAVAGVELKVQISSSFGGPGNTGPFTLTPSFTPAPANDDFAAAQLLTDDALTTGTNVAATTQLGDATNPPGWGIYGSVWYEYTATQTGVLGVELCSQFGHNLVPLFGSALGSLAIGGGYPAPVHQQFTDPAGCGYASAVSVPITSGQTVRLQVSSAYTGALDRGTFSIRATLRSQPANDQFASAVDLGAVPSVDQVGHNYAAEQFGSGEPAIVGQNRPRMVWYRWNSPITGAVSVDTCDTWGNLAVGAFDSAVPSPALGDLQPVGGAIGGCSAGQGAKVGFAATAGKDYWIAVASDAQDAYGEARFTLKLRLKPANDNWADAIDLGSVDSVSLDASSVNATADFDPDTMTPTGPTIGAQYRSSSVWFKWTAPHTGTFYADTCSGSPNNYDGYMAVYRKNGDVPPYYNLLDHAIDDDGCDGDRPRMPKLGFNANANETYWIAVAAFTTNADSGTNFTLELSSPPAATAPPQISGASIVVGRQLSTSNGTWAGPGPIAYTYAWLRCDYAGDNCTAIPSANASTYTPSVSDVGSSIRAQVTATNSVGSNDARSSFTAQVAPDSDGDGVGNADDDCNFAQTGTVKSNGCVPEGIEVTTASTIGGDRSQGSGSGLTVNEGVAANDPGDDPTIGAPLVDQIGWQRCESPSDTGTCDARTSNAPGDAYSVPEDDLGGYIRARVTWANADGEFVEWTAATPVYRISSGPLPTMAGTLQVGQTVTGDAGGAVNEPATETGDADPSLQSNYWYICSSPTDEDTCEVGPTGSTLVIPASAQGKYLSYVVVWENGIHTRMDASEISAQVAAAPAPPVVPPGPPALPTPLDLSKLTLPKKASFKKAVKAKGKFTLKSITFACPAGGPACVIDVTVTAKVNRKSKRVARFKQTVPAGSAAPLTGTLSKSGLKLFKSNKKLKATIEMKASGGGNGKATFKEFTITK